MKRFNRMDTVCIVKFHRIPKKRIGMYHVDAGVIFNTMSFPSRTMYHVQYFNDKVKVKGRTWLNEKYVFNNFDDAQEYADKLNEKLKINREARERVKKLYED